MAHTVTMSLSAEAYKVWRAFPKGTRSPSIAALLVDADRLRTQDILIENLRNQITAHRAVIYQMELRILNEETGMHYPSDASIKKNKEMLE
jgi:hypothetical protein